MDKLDGLNPVFADKVRKVLTSNLDRRLPPFDIFCGLRTFEEQDRLFCLGRTLKNPDGSCKEKPLGNIVTKARGGDSLHNYGLAVDIVFRNPEWNWNGNLPWDRLGKLGEIFGLEWGGCWKFKDLPHFQYLGRLSQTNMDPLTVVKSFYAAGGIQAVWDAL